MRLRTGGRPAGILHRLRIGGIFRTRQRGNAAILIRQIEAGNPCLPRNDVGRVSPFGRRGGEFYHGGEYLAALPELNAEIVFLGTYDKETGTYSLPGTAKPRRLQGTVRDFFAETPLEVPEKTFAQAFAKQNHAVSSWEEGGGSAYYIADLYLRLEWTMGSDEAATVLDVALDDSGYIRPDTLCWLTWPE